jgi:hypothetical protein
MEKDDEIVMARRLEGFGEVSIDVATLMQRDPEWKPSQRMFDTGILHAGDVVPMRRGEAEGRGDFEVVEAPVSRGNKET